MAAECSWCRIIDALCMILALGLAFPTTAHAGISGSAPSILSGLAPAWTAAFACGATIAPPFGPPQGALDPKLGAFLDGHLDFALLTREIAERDIQRFRAAHAGREPIVVPVANGSWRRFGYIDAVVPIVHPDNPIGSLSFRQIDAIFSTTRWRANRDIQTWGDLGLRGPWRDRPIRIMGGDAWEGEESARALTIRRHVLSARGKVGEWRSAPGGGGDHEVVERVAAEPGAIGFTGRGHVAPNVRVLAVAAPGRRAVSLDARSAAHGSYPLLRTVDLVFDRQASEATLAFARFLLSREGQEVVASQGDFMVLPEKRLTSSQRQLKALSGRTARAAASCWTERHRQAHNGLWPVFS